MQATRRAIGPSALTAHTQRSGCLGQHCRSCKQTRQYWQSTGSNPSLPPSHPPTIDFHSIGDLFLFLETRMMKQMTILHPGTLVLLKPSYS